MSTPVTLPPRPGPTTRVVVPLPRLSPGVRRFLQTEAGSAMLLLVATVAALIWANLPQWHSYISFWSTPISIEVGNHGLSLDLQHWINDAAMAIFFLVVGLEISREVTVGDLRTVKSVAAPALGAIGGLAVPALLYLLINHGGPGAHGWGIPMSTDTAFLVGILALFGPRCPDRLRLFLLTLAIVDDIGAIAVLGIFYTKDVSMVALLISALLVGVLALLRWLGVWRLTPYVGVGILLWLAVYASGVHPTLAGVLVGLLVPAKTVDSVERERLRYFGQALIERASPGRARLAVSAARAAVPANDRLQEALHPVSAFIVVPLFGLANAGVHLNADVLQDALTSRVTIGIILALLVGNTVGITLGATIALQTGLGRLPGGVRYGHVIGGAVLAGIGFTISLFVTDLAFDSPHLRDLAKIGVLTGSLLAAVLGSFLLRYLGERLPMCTLDDETVIPMLPPLPWRDPAAVGVA
ncbi:sodium/proton antiporter (NhaA family) [Jatrophihabitans sp. GAS493]|uniref:Na+/H+ antiporter NhaA n=1 Tax=Jatrophihabitans sp. GAS493 TaxID=1907575 RepID=UPI000BB692FD|nr:Na+/H+ antiporter NhaA [Jatrophihabitans sp. GAS493]SOD71670.1 sodium/proton antiporter (NhaA family) [Jatrophihabitans sp. GAS493]